jgi:7-cyano-7-deazaguanine synthase in queuosine biosynthesis
MAKDIAIVLNSGSVNSAVATALAAQKYRPVMLYAEAMQRPGSRMRVAYEMQVGHFKPYREHTLTVPYLAAGHDGNARESSDPRQPVLLGSPMVDLLPLLAAAATYAAEYAASAIYVGSRIGTDADELARGTEFFQIWSELLQQPCAMTDVSIETPLLELERWQVIDVGVQVSTPFEKTWSCVEEGSEPCWACRGCRERESAFQQAGKPDPLRIVRRI